MDGSRFRPPVRFDFPKALPKKNVFDCPDACVTTQRLHVESQLPSSPPPELERSPPDMEPPRTRETAQPRRQERVEVYPPVSLEQRLELLLAEYGEDDKAQQLIFSFMQRYGNSRPGHFQLAPFFSPLNNVFHLTFFSHPRNLFSPSRFLFSPTLWNLFSTFPKSFIFTLHPVIFTLSFSPSTLSFQPSAGEASNP